MFRNMRRKKQELSEEETVKILESGTSGVLAVMGDEDYPYAVPISYVYADSKIYFHGAKAGHKIDAIKNHDKVSFCVISENHIVPEEYTTYFRSAIAFGRIRVLEDEKEKMDSIEKLALKYHPTDNAHHREAAIQKEWKPLCVLEMSIEHMTGKEAIELVKRKNTRG